MTGADARADAAELAAWVRAVAGQFAVEHLPLRAAEFEAAWAAGNYDTVPSVAVASPVPQLPGHLEMGGRSTGEQLVRYTAAVLKMTAADLDGDDDITVVSIRESLAGNAANLGVPARVATRLAEQLAPIVYRLAAHHPRVARSVVSRASRARVTGLAGRFEVFLSYNSRDLRDVRRIAALLAAQGIRPWFDYEQVVAGTPFQQALHDAITTIPAAAVFIGRDAFGPWHTRETWALIEESVQRGTHVIPVILPGSPEVLPDLPIFIRGLTRVDFRRRSPDPLEQLVRAVRP